MLRFLIFQVMQIVLGVLSGVLGGFLYIFSSTTLRNSGAPIWTGAVVSGAGGQWKEWTRGERGRYHRPSKMWTVSTRTQPRLLQAYALLLLTATS